MKKKMLFNGRDRPLLYLSIFLCLSVIGITIGYSALNTNLTLSGDAYVRVDADIRITDLKMIEATNGAYETYNSKYSKDTTSTFATLSNIDSTITYEGTITNRSNKKYKLVDIILESTPNPKINFDITGLKIGDVINSNTEVKVQVKQSYNTDVLPSDKTNNLLIKYVFEEYDPTYVDASGANAPKLVTGLIPVVYNGTSWVSVDPKTEWYNYGKQMWANAVTTTEDNRSSYQVPGTIIPMSEINTMWVWIPRYEYKFSNLADQYAGGTASQPEGIDINFIQSDVTTASDPNNYIVHPAFTFGAEDLSGIWVGKFETGNQTACKVTSSVANKDCDLTTLGVQIKPNVSSWRGLRVSTAFTVSREMSNTGNIYGLNNSTTDSHMMKNIEWGAVAYLSQSAYGKYGNIDYIGANKAVYINNYWNNNATLTGCSAGSPSVASTTACAYSYNKNKDGTGASTTGNIYGIYDMSGGAYEYVMGNMKNSDNTQQQSGYQNTGNYNSGFTGINYDGTQVNGRTYPIEKYYDSYDHSTSNSDYSTRYIKGDATYEVSQGNGKNNGWYSDGTYFVSNQWSWLRRGGQHSEMASAGLFYFNSNYGQANAGCSFRIVLTAN